MEQVKGDNKVMLLEAFTKDTGIRLGIETRREYTWWLEQQLVKNLTIPVVIPRTFDPEFDEVECHYYELEQGTEDNTETCHLWLEIECCTHCYMNKALYGV